MRAFLISNHRKLKLCCGSTVLVSCAVKGGERLSADREESESFQLTLNPKTPSRYELNIVFLLLIADR